MKESIKTKNNDTITHKYEDMTEDNRPQDPNLDGSGLSFLTSEHGGQYPDTFPNVVIVTDEQGRRCVYAPIQEDGKDVISHGFNFAPTLDAKAEK